MPPASAIRWAGKMAISLIFHSYHRSLGAICSPVENQVYGERTNNKERVKVLIRTWQSAIDQLEASKTYQETVRRILETKLLRGEQSVMVYPIFGGYLNLDEVEG